MGQDKATQSEYQGLGENRFEWYFLSPRYWLVWLWLGFLWTVTRLPLLWVRRLGAGIGYLFYRLEKKRRHYAQTNIRLCFPEKTPEEQEAIVRASFEGAGMGLLESGLVWWTSFEKLAPYFELEGLDAVIEARARGEKVLMVAIHNTCMELGYTFMSHELPLNILFRLNNNPVWEYVARKGRERFKVGLVPRKQVKWFLHLLDEDVGLIAPDQDLGRKRSLFSPFFGIQTATVPSVSDFARQKNARVVLAYPWRTEKGFAVRVLPLLENYPTEDDQADTDLLNQMIEAAVREHPGDYLWVHRRFKTRPEGEGSLY